MIYIFEEGNVVFQGDILTQSQRDKAVVVTEKPIKETPEGKYAVLNWDVENQSAWYEYETVPLSENEVLEERLQLTEDTLLELMLGEL